MTNNSFWISLADLTVEINSKYDRLRSFCEEYIVTKDEKAEIAVSVTDDEIDSEMSLCGDLHSRAYCENLCIYRAIAERLPEYNRFVLHGAALSTFGKGYIFAAPSGVGKSTHVRLWRECFGDNVKIINGDKPIISVDNGRVSVHGTPWSGKEMWNINTSAPLQAICFIERGEVNKIEKIDPSESFGLLMSQIYVPKSGDAMLKTLELVNELAKVVDFYRLRCNISHDAAMTAFEAMVDEKNEI